MRRTARRRPLVRPVGIYTTERCARRAERYSRSFERLVRVPCATACGSSTTIETRKHEREASFSASRSFRPDDRVFTLSLRGTNERTSERTTVRARARRSRRRTIFFFISNTHSVIYEHSIATGRCRETEWPICGAHIVLAARSSPVPRRTRSDGSSRLPNINSTDTSSGR